MNEISQGRTISEEHTSEHRAFYVWIAVSLLAYIGFGVWLKSPVLNWIVGPLWLFATVYLIPAIFRAARSMVGNR